MRYKARGVCALWALVYNCVDMPYYNIMLSIVFIDDERESSSILIFVFRMQHSFPIVDVNWLYTSATSSMVIYHTSCSWDPQYDKTHG